MVSGALAVQTPTLMVPVPVGDPIVIEPNPVWIAVSAAALKLKVPDWLAPIPMEVEAVVGSRTRLLALLPLIVPASVMVLPARVSVPLLSVTVFEPAKLSAVPPLEVPDTVTAPLVVRLVAGLMLNPLPELFEPVNVNVPEPLLPSVNVPPFCEIALPLPEVVPVTVTVPDVAVSELPDANPMPLRTPLVVPCIARLPVLVIPAAPKNVIP